MRCDVVLLIFSCYFSIHGQTVHLQETEVFFTNQSNPESVTPLTTWMDSDTSDLAQMLMHLNISRRKRNVDRSIRRVHDKRKSIKQRKFRRKAENRRGERQALIQLRKGNNKGSSLLDTRFRTRRRSAADETKSLQSSPLASQDELLASVDDLPIRSATVEISLADPGLCKLDGVPMCKHQGECNSRDEGGAPVFFCSCSPAWGGDFCQEPNDPCAQGMPDCGTLFSCHRDETNTLAGFSCRCEDRNGWTPRSELDPRCQRITQCQDGNPCQHGGTCHQEEGGFVCICTPYGSGDLCEHPVATGSRPLPAPIVGQVTQLLQGGIPSPPRRRRWQSAPAYNRRRRRRRRQRGRRRQPDFLDQLLRDVEPQIRRTARDSVVELPPR